MSDVTIVEHPGWENIGCTSCRMTGSTWDHGTEAVAECRSCAGGGSYWLHAESGMAAQYPGGPILGTYGRPMR